MRYCIIIACALLLSCSTANVGQTPTPLPSQVQLNSGQWADVLGWVDVKGVMIPVGTLAIDLHDGLPSWKIPMPLLNDEIIAEMQAAGVTEADFNAAFSS